MKAPVTINILKTAYRTETRTITTQLPDRAKKQDRLPKSAVGVFPSATITEYVYEIIIFCFVFILLCLFVACGTFMYIHLIIVELVKGR